MLEKRKVIIATIMLLGISVSRANARIAVASRIDHESISCLSCHDGATASDVSASSSSTRARSMRAHPAGHPVGISYSSSALNKLGEYVPKGVLNPAIPLVDGKVSCVSCHKLTKPKAITGARGTVTEDRLRGCTAGVALVMKNERSALCLSCHIK
jgi:hypothetical protein